MSARFDFNRATPVTTLTLVGYALLALQTGLVSGNNESFYRAGAMVGLCVMDGEPWRLLTYAWLHGGLLHLAFNSMALWSFGPTLERLLGSGRFLAVYLVTAVGSGIAGCLWHNPVQPLVGGSGAIFGLFGAAVALNMRAGKSPLDFLNYQGPRQLLGLIATNLVLGFLIPQVSNAGHIGGLVTGLAFVYCFFDRKGRHVPDWSSRCVQAGWLALLAAALLWCLMPVTRWDHRLREAATTRDPVRKAALEEIHGRPIALDLAELRQVAPLAARIKRWKP